MPKRKMLGFILMLSFTLIVGAGTTTFAYGAEAAPTGGTSPSPASGSEGASSSGQAVTPDTYIIQADDILTIDGSPHLELRARSYRVSEDGTIMMLYLKRIEVKGLSKRQLQDKLMEMYDPKYFKNVVINVEVRIKSFNIVGEVRNPGIKDLLTQTSILTAIASAGDFTEYADPSKVIVIRLDKEGMPTRQTIDCKAILRGKAPDSFLVKPNDVISVLRKGFLGI